jgi:hypothetical protein
VGTHAEVTAGGVVAGSDPLGVALKPMTGAIETLVAKPEKGSGR